MFLEMDFAVSGSLKINLIIFSTQQILLLKYIKKLFFVISFKMAALTCSKWSFSYSYRLFTTIIICFCNLFQINSYVLLCGFVKCHWTFRISISTLPKFNNSHTDVFVIYFFFKFVKSYFLTRNIMTIIIDHFHTFSDCKIG